MAKLNQAALSAISDFPAPRYRRSMDNQICHIGVGNFHRAHQAVYLHRLLQSGDCDNWGICGIALMPGDRTVYEALRSQAGLYSVWELDNDSTHGEIIGSIMRLVDAINDPSPALAALCEPATRIVSLTITEKGYYLNTESHLDLDNPVIRRDLNNRDCACSAIGLIVRALEYRLKKNMPPFTVLSCDNMLENGDKTRRATVEFAAQYNHSLAAWIENNVSFPLSMVDRITPIPTKALQQQLLRNAPFDDDALVYCEPWLQWVLEDKFSDGRPPFEKAGVIFSEYLPRYEAMKVNLLNGGHSALAHKALQQGFEYVHEAAADQTISEWLDRYWEAVIETLEPMPGIDYFEYCQKLLKRFRNATINDRLMRLAEDSSSKFREHLIPSLKKQVSHEGSIGVFAEALAEWIRFLGQSPNDTLNLYKDTDKETLVNNARTALRTADSSAFISYALGNSISSLASHKINEFL